MAELKFQMLADYTQAIEGGNKFADMLNKARKELQNTKTTSEDYSKAVDVYKQAITGLSEVIDRNGGTMADLNKVYNMASKEMVRLAQSIGTSNEAYRKAAEIAEIYDKRIFDLTKKKEEAAKADALRAKKLKEEAEETERVEKMTQRLIAELDRNRLDGFSDAIDEINRSMREMEEEERQLLQLEAQKNQLNQQNANLGFMMLTGDDLGLATYSLREYESTLKRVIAETGINSEETKKAYEQYAKQKEYVDQLNESTKRYNTTKETSVKVEEKHSLKLLSVAKNILKFQLLMAPITAVIRGFKNTLSDSMKVAAEAEQRFNKLATVFDGFEDSAKRMASSLASALGVANSTSASALSTVGDLLQAQGMGTADSLLKSAEWVKQFQDIIAFKDINMSLEEFAQNFMSGAAGNLRNFRTFGSIVKESAVNARLAAEGLDKLTGSQLELAKMTTRATMALEQQKNAVGATEREWDTMLSVNRRLSESWKEYKENLGDTINAALKPLKEWWTRILEETNKAKKAQEEYNKGAKESSVHRDVRNNPEDAKNFRSSLTSAVSEAKITLSSLYDMRGQTLSLGRLSDDSLMSEERAIIVGQLKNIDQILFAFGVSVKDASEIIGKDIPEAAYRYLEVLEKRRKADKEFLDAQEARKAKLSSAADSFSALQETLLGISGVNFNPRSITELVNRGQNSDKGMKDALNKMTSLTSDIIKESLESLDASDLAQTFGDVISRELGELDEADLLQGKADSYRKLFEAAWNAYLPGGIDSKERLALDNIKKSYKEATAALDEYNKKIQRQNALLNANATIASAMSSYSRLKYENGLTGSQAENDYEMATVWDIPLQIAEFAKALREVGVDIKTVIERSKAYQRVLEQEAALKFRAAFAAERNAVLDPYRSSAENYRTQYLNLGLSDAQATRNKLMEEYNQAVVDEDNELITAISGTILWFDKLQGALKEQEQIEAQKTLKEQINPFTSTIDAYNTGKTALEGKSYSVFGKSHEITGAEAGIIGILSQLLSQTEVFSELTNLVSDTIVPILDAVMKPLIPMINVVKTIFDLLPWETLFEIFKMVAEVVVAISFPIRIMAAVVKNIYTAVHNILQRIIHPITGGDQWAYESLAAILDDTNEKLDKLNGLAFKIERNTEKGDLSALWDLYNSLLIDEQTFYKGADVLQKNIPFEALVENRPIITVKIQNTIVDESGNIKASEERTFEENGYEINTPITRSWLGYGVSGVGRYKMAMGGR